MKVNLAKPVQEWVSIGKGALIAGAAVALTYVSQHVTASDFGTYGPLVVGLLSVVVNILRKMVDNEPTQTSINSEPELPPTPTPMPSPPPGPPPIIPIPFPWPIPWPMPTKGTKPKADKK